MPMTETAFDPTAVILDESLLMDTLCTSSAFTDTAAHEVPCTSIRELLIVIDECSTRGASSNTPISVAFIVELTMVTCTWGMFCGVEM